MLRRITRLLRHWWLDLADVHRVLPDDMAERLARRVAASEGRHTGEVRLCVEASLPTGEAWQAGAVGSLKRCVRERALGWFGRLGVWDTEHNNGVLIYLLLAERSIEIVADRALAQLVSSAHWQSMVASLAERLRAGDVEDGLTQAMEEVSALLVAHFPASEGWQRANELPDCVVRV
jgi:uncharacterized membrane protein